MDTVIPVKFNSTRLPKKNLIPFVQGMNLIEFKLSQLTRCDFVDNVFLSVDDMRVVDYVKTSYESVHFIQRPKELCYDLVPMNEIYQHLGEIAKSPDVLYTTVTTPMINEEVFHTAYINFKEKQGFSLHTVELVKDFIVDEFFNCVNFNKIPFPRSQDLRTIYKMVYGFAMLPKSELMKGTSFPESTMPFVLDSKTALDIDNKEEFEYAQFLLR